MNKDQIQALETALRVLSDIKSLRQNEAFRRYWLTRVAEKKAQALKRYIDEPANETTRQIIKAYEEIEGFMDLDERASMNTVNAINPAALKPTTQDSHAS